MTSANEQNVPLWKGIVSWQAAFALLALGGFFFTIVSPDKVPSAGSGSTDRVVKDLNLSTESVLSDVSKSQPMKLVADGRFSEALGEADAELKAKPHDVKTLMAAGDAYCEAGGGDPNKGLALLEKSVALCPESRYVRLNYGRHLGASKKTVQAIAQYEVLDKSASPEWTGMRIELANLYLTNNENGKAVDVLKRVMQNDTKNGGAQEILGMAMARNNDGEEGFEEFSKGYAIRKVQNGLTELKAYLAKHDNRKSKAEAALTREVKDDPENQALAILLGELLLSENKTQAAKDLLLTN